MQSTIVSVVISGIIAMLVSTIVSRFVMTNVHEIRNDVAKLGRQLRDLEYHITPRTVTLSTASFVPAEPPKKKRAKKITKVK